MSTKKTWAPIFKLDLDYKNKILYIKLTKLPPCVTDDNKFKVTIKGKLIISLVADKKISKELAITTNENWVDNANIIEFNKKYKITNLNIYNFKDLFDAKDIVFFFNYTYSFLDKEQLKYVKIDHNCNKHDYYNIQLDNNKNINNDNCENKNKNDCDNKSKNDCDKNKNDCDKSKNDCDEKKKHKSDSDTDSESCDLNKINVIKKTYYGCNKDEIIQHNECKYILQLFNKPLMITSKSKLNKISIMLNLDALNYSYFSIKKNGKQVHSIDKIMDSATYNLNINNIIYNQGDIINVELFDDINKPSSNAQILIEFIFLL